MTRDTGVLGKVARYLRTSRAYYKYAREEGESAFTAAEKVADRFWTTLSRKLKGQGAPVFMEGDRRIYDHVPPVPALPEGFTVRTYRPGDEAGMARVYAVSWLDAATPEAVLEQVVGDPCFANDNLFVIEHAGQIVATGAAYHYADAPHIGNGRMVGVLPKYRSHGLGTIMSLTMMHYHRDHGFKLVRYATNEWRYDAIRLFIDLGFYPLLDSEQDRERWKRIAEKVKRPDVMAKAKMREASLSPATVRN